MKFSLTSMMVYKEVFDDALVCFDELKIESKPIGEGTSKKKIETERSCLYSSNWQEHLVWFIKLHLPGHIMAQKWWL